MTRLAQCSPVATRTGATPRAIAAWPSTSSGNVGSSIHQRSNFASVVDARDRLVDVPALVGVDHQLARPGRSRSRTSADAPCVVFGRAADLDLEMRPAVGERLAAQARGSSRRSSRTSRPRSCRRDSRARGATLRARLASALPLEDLQRLFGRERVGDVAEVDARRRSARASCPRAASRAASARPSHTDPRPR